MGGADDYYATSAQIEYIERLKAKVSDQEWDEVLQMLSLENVISDMSALFDLTKGEASDLITNLGG